MTDEIHSEAKEMFVTLQLNKQQLELLDRTIAAGVAPDRASLVRLALAEYAASYKLSSKTGAPK